MLSSMTNEQRASVGEQFVVDMAAENGCEHMPVVTCVEMTLQAIAHACDRYGLPPAEAFRDALRAYRKDLEEGPCAATWVRGEHTLMSEVREPCLNLIH